MKCLPPARNLQHILMTRPLSKFSENLSVTSVVALSQTIIGLGAGMLISDRLSPKARQRSGLILVGTGVAAAIPLIIGVVGSLVERPNSSRAVHRRLRSIRYDSGVAEGESVV